MLLTLLLVLAAFVGGALNAVAGGGTFVIFPALVFSGVPPIQANATCTVSVFPGAFASAIAYRREIRKVAQLDRINLPALLAVSLAGGVAGAVLLLATPQSVFEVLIPWLLLFATVLFVYGRPVASLVERHMRIGPVTLLAMQFIIAVYGGYFGGGIGILMLAAWTVFGLTDINAMNGMKTLMAGALNGIAVVVFVAANEVYWREAAILGVSAILGGYAGAAVARSVDPRYVRTVVAVTGAAMTVYFFLKD